jgi:purine-binding chemotaxis protein CheW
MAMLNTMGGFGFGQVIDIARAQAFLHRLLARFRCTVRGMATFILLSMAMPGSSVASASLAGPYRSGLAPSGTGLPEEDKMGGGMGGTEPDLTAASRVGDAVPPVSPGPMEPVVSAAKVEMTKEMEATGVDRKVVDEMQLVTFTLARGEFGVPIELVKEIVRVPEITRVPKAPAFVEGIANLRGNVWPVVNLRQRFDLPLEERTDDNRVVVIEIKGRMTGMVVDLVSEVMRISRDSVEPAPAVVASAVDSAYLQGVIKLQEGKRLILLLDIENILPSLEMAGDVSGGHGATQANAQATRQVVDEEQLVGFVLSGEEYAVEIANVQEIIRVTEISQVPQAPDFVEGVMALRSRLLPIINLRKRFGLPAVEVNDDSRIIVVNLNGMITGIQVDAVSEVLSVPRDAIQAPPAILSRDEADQLRGVAKLDDGRRLIMLLDVKRLLSLTELSQLEDVGSTQTADASAADQTSRRQIADEEQYVSFRVEDEEFGVNIHQVQEIIWLPEITRVPRAPHYVEGMVNLRGNVLPVVSVRKRFELQEAEPTDSTSIVVVDIEGSKTGIIVDSVSEVLRFSGDAVEPPPAVVGNVNTSFVRGVGKLQNGQRMLLILDLPCLLAHEAVGLASAGG